LCLEWSAYLNAQDKLKKSRIVKGKDKVYRVSPAVRVADRALSNCRALWTELGLTPSSRARFSAVPTARPRVASTMAPASKWSGVL